MLHKMERDGYLVSRQEREGRTVRKLYTITPKGKEGLALARTASGSSPGRRCTNDRFHQHLAA